MRAWLGCAIAVVTAGCVSAPRFQCSDGAECPGGLCVANACAHADPDCPSGAHYELGGCVEGLELDAGIDAAAVVACQGGQLSTCLGDRCALTDCDLGCLELPTPHCGRFAPANLPAGLDPLSGVTAALALNVGPVYIDTTDGAITIAPPVGPATLLRDGGEGVVAGIRFEILDGDAPTATLGVANLIVAADTTIYVTGPRALILVSADELTMAGTIDVSHCAAPSDGDRTCPGPGGGAGGPPTLAGGGCAGGGAPILGSGTSGGGASGGNLARGTAGGAGSAGGSSAGLPTVNTCGTATASPLVGGSGGAGSATASGGAGGGAIELVAFGKLTLGGRIQAGGRGGGGALVQTTGGGGGGAGGTVLIQAPTVDLTGGGIAANGGGGGCGNCSAAGNDGPLSSTNAAGGAVGGGAVAGGRGGANSAAAAPGANAVSTMTGGGGGGGAWGVIRIDSFHPVVGDLAFESPAPTPSLPHRGAIIVQ